MGQACWSERTCEDEVRGVRVERDAGALTTGAVQQVTGLQRPPVVESRTCRVEPTRRL